MTVYIPTLGRPAILKKSVPTWLLQGMPVRLVVPFIDYQEHVNLVKEMGWRDVRVIQLPEDNWGIGASRAFIVRHARKSKLKAIIMSDDDHKPAKGDFRELLDAAMDDDVLGIGASRSLTDRFNGGKLTALDGVILCPGGWGFTTYGLNIRNAILAGNFDPELHTFADDAELARNGIAKLRIPWRIHCDVWIAPLNKRYDPGGMNTLFDEDLAERAEYEMACKRLIYSRWPKYVNPPEKAPRMAWTKMLTDYIPDWKAKSALHGGSLGE